MIRLLLAGVLLILLAGCDAHSGPAPTSTVTVTVHPMTPIDL